MAAPAAIEGGLLLPSAAGRSRASGLLRAVAVASVLVAAWGFTYWVAHYNNRAPTPIDGIWTVENEDGPLERVFFEYNRAHMAVFRTGDGTDQVHHFEVEPGGRIRVWERYLDKGPLIYEGRTLGPDRIRLEGRKEPEVVLRLARESGPPLSSSVPR